MSLYDIMYIDVRLLLRARRRVVAELVGAEAGSRHAPEPSL